MEFDFDKELIKVYLKIAKYAYRYGLSDEERQDLVSDTILKIIEKRDMFRIQGENYSFAKFVGWCGRIMNNLFINNYRREMRQGVVSYDENPLSLFQNEPLYECADERIISDELLREIYNTEKNCVNLKILFGWMNGISYEQLSEIFELPLGTIKSRLFITRKKLKSALVKQGYNRTIKS